ncbi:Ohr family peroxiredoxin [Aerococcaceae bacterium zg-ZUI334]|uniref:Ohr family peroxiredoxin n=1 Tax=Aerococcaceae bacterium zg-252 TaxID=2796928 RepID=UPI001B9E6CE0|nr:Ohr family peroxiredoxin [Aerococcaceae bacterium zg-ZUI334]
MQKIYTTKMTNTGGRTGEVHAPDASIQFQIVQPGQKVAGATNPEQLFAAGFSSCFNSALSYVLQNKKIDAESTVSAIVSLYNVSTGLVPDVVLGVKIEGHIEGVSLEEAQALLEEAHKVCPYSRAVAGNIEVEVQAI